MTKRREIVKELLDAGFVLRPSKRSNHDNFVKEGIKRPVPVPRHRELDDITASEIRKQAGLR